MAEFKSVAVLPHVQGHIKGYQSLSAGAENNKEFAPSSSLTRHFGRTYSATKGHSAEQDGVVYRTSCECDNVYIRETRRLMQERIKEHDKDIRLARILISPVTEHAHETGHCLISNQVRFIDRDPHWHTRIGSRKLSK